MTRVQARSLRSGDILVFAHTQIEVESVEVDDIGLVIAHSVTGAHYALEPRSIVTISEEVAR